MALQSRNIVNISDFNLQYVFISFLENGYFLFTLWNKDPVVWFVQDRTLGYAAVAGSRHVKFTSMLGLVLVGSSIVVSSESPACFHKCPVGDGLWWSSGCNFTQHDLVLPWAVSWCPSWVTFLVVLVFARVAIHLFCRNPVCSCTRHPLGSLYQVD